VEGDSATCRFVNEIPAGFFTVEPCRVMDTREWGGRLRHGESVSLDSYVLGLCGVPAAASAVVLNVTAAEPSGAGHLSMYVDDVPPPAASLLNFTAGATRANNAVVQMPTSLSQIVLRAVLVGEATVDVVVDVSGYFQ
jgi:hypothetical protein